MFYIAELAARLGLSIQPFDLSTQSYGKGTRRHAAYVLDGTIAGVALHATEDALEPGFVKAMSQPILGNRGLLKPSQLKHYEKCLVAICNCMRQHATAFDVKVWPAAVRPAQAL